MRKEERRLPPRNEFRGFRCLIFYEIKRIESKIEVETYLARLQYALKSGKATVYFQKDRKIDTNRDKIFTNRYTILNLFPDEDEVEVLKRELLTLSVEEYIETVKDKRFLNRSEMRVFGKNYHGKDVYIKIRVELINGINSSRDNYIFVMSFHFSEQSFVDTDFPYRKNRGVQYENHQK
jgi:hypothetical protein